MSQITLYTNEGSPYGQYVEIALHEAKAQYTRYEVNLQNKPSWFTQVNPIGKVPAITYGGPITPPDQPSPESHKLAESLVLLEFFNDIFPEAGLLPKDPIQRAAARFFINAVLTKLHPAFVDSMLRRGSPDAVLQAIDYLQKLLPEESKGPFVAGNEFSNADAVAATYFVRVDTFFKADVGSFHAGEGIKAYQELQDSPRFARYRAYLSIVKTRESVTQTYDGPRLLAMQSDYAISRRA